MAIEGNMLSENEVKDIIDGKTVMAPLRQIQEVKNAIKTYELYEKLNPFDVNDLLKAHGTMMMALTDDAGKFRRGGVGVFSEERLVHMAPPADHVPILIDDLFEWLKQAKDHLLIRSCVFHYEFEFIHPFSDGNGRMGRLWQSLILGRLHPLFEYLPVENMVYANQEAYYNEIIRSVIRTGRAPELVIAFCNLIRRLVVDHLHVVGDIFDRGPYPNLIMDTLMQHHSVDIQWGNHDIYWMGAAAGSRPCICNAIRISAKYGNLNLLEDGYGINLVPLARLAMSRYDKDPCTCFKLDYREDEYDVRDAMLDEKMHKAITVIQFKLEGQMIMRHPEFGMDERLLLDKINIEKGTVCVEGKEYPMKDLNFPTIDWKHPYELSSEEEDVMERITQAFLNCEKLQRHVRFLFTQGSLYKVYNGNLLYHGCVPMNEDGTFTRVNVYGKEYSGKALYDVLENYARKGYYAIDPGEKKKGLDILWFIWENQNSPVFGKAKMTTFERYFIADKATHQEPKNPYYRLLEEEEVVNRILSEFGLEGAEAHIINGHIPVEAKRGESPVKCGGKLLIIDGGFSKAYQPKTGIAGYTLIYNSYGLVLAAHEPFESVEKAVQDGSDIASHTILVQHVVRRKLVADTDIGRELRASIRDLEALLQAYRDGILVEKI